MFLQIRRFIKSYKKFAVPAKRLNDVAADAELTEKPMSELTFLAEQLRVRCENCLAESENTATKDIKTEEDENKGPGRKRRKGPTFKLGGVMVNAKSFSAAVTELEPLDHAIPSDPEQRANWQLDVKCVFPNSIFYSIVINLIVYKQYKHSTIFDGYNQCMMIRH